MAIRFLIGYGVIARLSTVRTIDDIPVYSTSMYVDEKQQRCSTNRVSKEGYESGIRRGRGTREAVTAKVKVAGISRSNVKAEELDSPLAGRAGVVQ
jgi:hypothetical protein